MTDKIKEKLLKEFRNGDGIIVVDYLLEKAIEETKKAERERILKLLDELKVYHLGTESKWTEEGEPIEFTYFDFINLEELKKELEKEDE